MPETEQKVSVDSLHKAFQKISAGLDPVKLSRIEKEMRKIVPTENSEVIAMPGYIDEDNRLSISLYISEVQEVSNLKFDDIIEKLLKKISIDKLDILNKCVLRLESKGTKYDIDATEIRYSDSVNSYNTELYIFKA